MTSNFHVFDGEFNSKSLEVDNNEKDQNSSEQIIDIRERASIEGLLDSSEFILSGDQRVEEGNNGTFIFDSHFGSGGNGGESFPDDGFTDVGGNEKGDS